MPASAVNGPGVPAFAGIFKPLLEPRLAVLLTVKLRP